MRSEKVDTRQILAGYLGHANGTHPGVRAKELAAVTEYWPDHLLRDASEKNVPWRALVDPTVFHDVKPDEVHGFVAMFSKTYGRWPSIDGIRRRFGRVSNHRAPGEVEGQGSLL